MYIVYRCMLHVYRCMLLLSLYFVPLYSYYSVFHLFV
jgi:hypothetical protein